MTPTLPPARYIDPASAPPFRWGVIGTGIAGRFVDSLHSHTTQRAVAVAARDLDRTEAFAREHSVERVFGTTTALIESSEIDVVYIATPHPQHRDLALEAIAAGKHVLIEKPIAMSAHEASDITAAGRAAGVLVMEAMWTRYLPQSDIVRQVVASGLLGDLRLVRADFGFVMPFLPDHRLWSAELGGGALLDAGIYPISFVSSVLGSPSMVIARGSTAPTGVDASADVMLASADGATGIASTSIITSMPVTAEILGSAGRLLVHGPFIGPSGLTLTTGSFFDESSTTWIEPSLAMYDGMSCQATALAKYVAEGRVESPVHPHAEIVSIMATIDEARHQIAALPVNG
ncbi:Inositol 2-dehydrogenase/D-chiro-inositol 3-dehydrogenase [Propionicimonas sp. T2.31MG-18]|uniref:Gfo/Idh/MocA family protein n=1 Tax=Propionicimonas sp. T2.31MG-18 TaxID=3157620 RepID=UPI0035E879A1